MSSMKIDNVRFADFRTFCKLNGFDPKEKPYGKGWYFKNLSGDKAVKLLKFIIEAGPYLPQPYRLGILHVAITLKPLLAAIRSTNPQKEFGYEHSTGRMDLYRDAIIKPIRLLHRLLGLLLPNVIRYSGISKKMYCIGMLSSDCTFHWQILSSFQIII